MFYFAGDVSSERVYQGQTSSLLSCLLASPVLEPCLFYCNRYHICFYHIFNCLVDISHHLSSQISRLAGSATHPFQLNEAKY